MTASLDLTTERAGGCFGRILAGAAAFAFAAIALSNLSLRSFTVSCLSSSFLVSLSSSASKQGGFGGNTADGAGGSGRRLAWLMFFFVVSTGCSLDSSFKSIARDAGSAPLSKVGDTFALLGEVSMGDDEKTDEEKTDEDDGTCNTAEEEDEGEDDAGTAAVAAATFFGAACGGRIGGLSSLCEDPAADISDVEASLLSALATAVAAAGGTDAQGSNACKR
jgi:hypothetical protein